MYTIKDLGNFDNLWQNHAVFQWCKTTNNIIDNTSQRWSFLFRSYSMQLTTYSFYKRWSVAWPTDLATPCSRPAKDRNLSNHERIPIEQNINAPDPLIILIWLKYFSSCFSTPWTPLPTLTPSPRPHPNPITKSKGMYSLEGAYIGTNYFLWNPASIQRWIII